MFRRISLTALLLVGSALALASATMEPVKAWTGDLPQCVNLPPSGVDYISDMQSEDPDVNFYSVNSTFFASSYSTDTPTSDWFVIWYDIPYQITLSKSGSDYGFTAPAGGIVAYYIGGTLQYTDTLAAPFSGGLYTASGCYFAAHNLNYANSWDIDELQNTSASVNECDPLDFACWLERTFDGVADTFTGVTKALLQGITFLFVPPASAISNSFGVLKDTFEDKLGFLGYPLTFFIDVFNATLDTSVWGPTSTSGLYDNCAFEFGAFMGADLSINLCAFGETWPDAWAIVRTIVIAFTCYFLMAGFYHKFMTIARHH